MKSSSCALVVSVLILVLGGGYYFYAKRNGEQNNAATPSGSALKDQGTEENNNFPIAEPEKVELLAVSGEGRGIAIRSFSGQQFIHTITAQLPEISKNQYYAGWLSKTISVEVQYLSTGRFEPTGEDFYLEFHDIRDLNDYKHITVSLEEKAVTAPTKIILEGDFK